jgi:hypothetical protein
MKAKEGHCCVFVLMAMCRAHRCRIQTEPLPHNQFLPFAHAVVEVLPEPEIKWEAPFLAINKIVVSVWRPAKC